MKNDVGTGLPDSPTAKRHIGGPSRTPVPTKAFFNSSINANLTHKKQGRLSAPLLFYFFMCCFTMASTSSGVSMGLAISFLGQTAAHRPQEVQME